MVRTAAIWRAGLFGAALAQALALASPARAETIRVPIYSMPSNVEAARLNSVMVTRFSGDEGERFSLDVEAALLNIEIRGERYFRVVPDAPGSTAEAVVDGTHAIRINERRYEETRQSCVEEDAEGECLRFEDVKVGCFSRTIELDVNFRILADARTLVLSQPAGASDSSEWCEDSTDPRPRDAGEVVRGMEGQAIYQLTRAVAPYVGVRSIRLRESRRDLPREHRDAFRDAVRLTQTNLGEGCNGFLAIHQAIEPHPSVVYNLGLCSEAFGMSDAAESYWRSAAALLPREDEPANALNRINRRRRVDALLEARGES